MSRLTRAIERASAAGEWGVVELLGRQLEVLARGPNVVDLADARLRKR
ncbi:MAG: hypothetical protein KIT84_08145 [Labilithrix sp.]|nr:hypothetical protein [Labilithrix sp.]MCW5810967.1 hypothetical protein [Labilithrix sp.]